MLRNHIFISYSHRDQQYLDELLVYLKHWQDEGLLDIWSDRRLKASQDWHEEIQRAIEKTGVALLLVSQNFLNSKYIKEHELPPLLQAREQGKIALTCLFLEPAHVGEPLTKYQGLNTPKDPVSSYKDEHDRKELYKRVTEKLRALAEPSPKPRLRQPEPDRAELTVRLNYTAGKLTRAYFHYYGRIREYRSPWEPRRTVSNEALFETLFGPPEKDQSGQVLQTVFASDVEPNPILSPLRLRIQTDDPVLANLPWHQTSWQGYRLWKLGWTFELIGPTDPAEFREVFLQAPCPVLMIAPQPAGVADLGGEAHFRALRERLDHAWPVLPGRIRKAADWSGSQEAFGQRRPRIVYYYGPAEFDGGVLKLHFELPEGGSDFRPLTTLPRLWGNHPPQVLFLNLVGETPFEVGTAAAPLHPDVPLIVTQSGTFAELKEARRAALEWFHELLETGEDVDPVWALHRVGPPTAAAWTAYHRWRTRTSEVSPKEALAHLLLDRKVQRARGRSAVDELVRENQRRLACLLVYGATGNLVENFADQFLEHLRRNAREVAHVHRLRLRLPAGETFDANRIEDQVRRDLGLEPRVSLRDALTRKKPRAPGRARPLLLLDWGARGQTSRLKAEALTAWVEFCCEVLCAECPPELRLLSCLALESPDERHQAIETAVQKLRNEPRFRNRAFRLELLDPLDRVDAADLADFLDSENCSCPDDLLGSLPELMLKKTGGRFDATVRQIELAERTSWYALFDDLNRQPDASPPAATIEDDLL